jgi:hypothetical protein
MLSQKGENTNTTGKLSKIPLKGGKPDQKEVKGNTLFWCGRCKCWNHTHCTSEHVAKGDGSGKQPSEANFAENNTKIPIKIP